MPEPRILLSGLGIGAAPRWHDNRLWRTDMGTREVLTINLAGAASGRRPRWAAAPRESA